MIATANDISKLPPELLRKGRFDEIFFVDLPDAAARRDIFTVHLVRRGRSTRDGGPRAPRRRDRRVQRRRIEQVVISALYSAFAEGMDLTTEALEAEAKATRPLSVTMSEKSPSSGRGRAIAP